MAEFEITTTGIDELNAKLTSITEDMRKKGGRYALRKAAQIIQKDAQQKARLLDDPSTSENIAANIALRWNGRLYKRTGDLGFRIGVLGGARPQSGTVGYWRFLEFGTSKATAKPFMRPALQENIANATNEFVTQYNKAIDRAIKRAKK